MVNEHRMKQGLVLDAMRSAISLRRPNRETSLLHHSNRGSQYTCETFRELLAEENITCSMSVRGNCWDSAMKENFFASLKKERIHQEQFEQAV